MLVIKFPTGLPATCSRPIRMVCKRRRIRGTSPGSLAKRHSPPSPDAIRAQDADDAVARQAEGELLEQHPVVEALDQVVDLDDHAAQAGTRRDLDLFEVQLAALVRLRGHL